jgi:hypothetical protein
MTHRFLGWGWLEASDKLPANVFHPAQSIDYPQGRGGSGTGHLADIISGRVENWT